MKSNQANKQIFRHSRLTPKCTATGPLLIEQIKVKNMKI